MDQVRHGFPFPFPVPFRSRRSAEVAVDSSAAAATWSLVKASPRTGSILFLFLFFLFFPMDGGVKVAGRPALNPRALRELLPNCWRVVAAMEKVLGSGRSNWNPNGSAVTAASGYRPSPSILNASLNTWYT